MNKFKTKIKQVYINTNAGLSNILGFRNYYDDLHKQLNDEISKINRNIIVNIQLASILMNFKNFEFIPIGEIEKSNNGLYCIGTLRYDIENSDADVLITVYCDPYMSWDDTRIIYPIHSLTIWGRISKLLRKNRSKSHLDSL